MKPQEILKQAREKSGYTQEVIAEEIGVSSRMYQRYESGMFPKYKGGAIDRLDKLLGIDLSAILYDKNSRAEQNNGAVTTPLSGSITINDHIAEIEKRIAEVEARRRDAEAMYQDAKKDKGILYDLIKENLALLVVNSNETLKRLEKVLLFDRADHETIMNSQDRAEHLPRGTSTKAAGNLAVQKAKHLRKKDKSHQRDVDK